MPPKMWLVPNSTYIVNSTYPKGKSDSSNNIINGGLIIGNYGSGANAYVTFSAVVASAGDLACGWNDFRGVGVVHPAGMGEYYNTADLEVGKTC